MRPRNRAFAEFLFLLWILSVAPRGHGQAPPEPRRWELDIPAQPVTLALQAFSRQTDLQHGYLPNSDAEEQTISGALKGTYTADEALRVLLPAGFTYEWVDERSLSIISPPVITPPRLYLGDDTLDAESVPFAFERARKKLEGMLVVGSRIWSLDPQQLPTVDINSEEIKALGVSTIPELLRYLTQQPFSRSDLSNTGDQRVELRGLGRDTTLVLINGRRAGSSSASFDLDAFDLSVIPLTAVERIEVILDCIPFGIGADAIGGMVNIVLRKEFSKPIVEVNYGAVDGGGEERRISISGGKGTKRVQVSVVLDHFERSDLLGSERDRWRNQDFRRFGSTDWRSLATNPGNVTSLTMENLPGLTSRIAAVPSHDPGTPVAADDFFVTQGQRNFDSLRRYRSVAPERERSSVVASAEGNVSSTTVLFGELLYTKGTTIAHDLPFTLSNVVVPETNAFNPFGTPVSVSFLPISVGPRVWTTHGEFLRESAGLQGRWHGWAWELSALHTRDSTRVAQEGELDSMRVADALAQSDPDRAFNVFDEGSGGSPDLIASLIATPTLRDYRSTSSQATAHLRGEVLDLPGGALTVSIGAERREFTLSVDTRLPQSPARTLDAAFAEIRVPIVSPGMAIRGIRDLAFTASGRVDNYSDVGRVSNSQVALTWHPTKPLSVRATYGTTYRPPSLFELYLPVVQLPVALPDLKRNNQFANVLVSLGGNPNLEPTTAHSWSAGLSFMPESASHLTMAATYWHARLEDRVTPIVLQILLSHDELFPSRVVRAPPTPADVAAGLPGTLLALDVRPGNVGSLNASGIDLSMSLDVDTWFGQLKPTLSVTWMDEFTVIDLPGLPAVDRVGLASVLGTVPMWRAVAGVTWIRGALSATTTARFLSSYDDFNAVFNQRNGRTVPSQTFLDVQASFEFDRYVEAASAWRSTRVSAGVTNVFDKLAPFAELGADFGYDITQGDLNGRFGYIRLEKRF